jgi:hypothetical protein
MSAIADTSKIVQDHNVEQELWSPDEFQAMLFDEAGLDPDEPANILSVAIGLGIEVRFVDRDVIPTNALSYYDPIHCLSVVLLRMGLPVLTTRFDLAHEIVETRTEHLIGDGREAFCNATAACMLAPRRAYIRRLEETGEDDYGQMALPFRMTQTAAALRAAEVTGRRLCVVTPHRIYSRGQRWPEERRLRRWAQQDLPGLRKTRLTDDAQRLVLEGEAPASSVGYGA